MIETLVSGKLQGQPEQRTAKTGRAYVQAKMRVSAGANEVHFVRVAAFTDSACAALLALGDGDALAVAGTLKPGAWLDRDGKAKPNLDLVAAQVLTVYHLKRRREAVQPGQGGTDAAPAGRQRKSQRAADTDAGDFDGANDAWLKGAAE
jgi:single-stranded DNA-binding protein